MRCMAGNIAATPRASALGFGLRELRTGVGRSLREFARELGIDQSTLSRWETGARTPRVEDVAMVLGALGVTDERREELLELARNVDRPQWLGSSQRHVTTWLEIEASASTVRAVAPLLIPGLLQTAGYARAIMRSGDVPADEVELRVALRMGRRDVLTRGHKPRLVAVIGEAALRTQIGGATVMRDQLTWLVTMAEWENVDIRAVPFSAGWHPGLTGPFVLVERDGAEPIVHIEMPANSMFLHMPKDVAGYMAAAVSSLQAAMDPEESVKFIAEIMSHMDDEGNVE